MCVYLRRWEGEMCPDKTVKVTWKAKALECIVLAFMSKGSVIYLGSCPGVPFSDTERKGIFCLPCMSLLVSQQCVY